MSYNPSGLYMSDGTPLLLSTPDSLNRLSTNAAALTAVTTIADNALLTVEQSDGTVNKITGASLKAFILNVVSGSGSSGSSGGTGTNTGTSTASTRARFAMDTATAGTSSTATALFNSMVLVANPTSDRNGTMTTTADQTKYTWVAVLASAAGSGMHFFDGTGYGGFNGANATSIYTGADADPTTIHQTYTDSANNVWNLYRSSGHSVALTFTLS